MIVMNEDGYMYIYIYMWKGIGYLFALYKKHIYKI